MARVRQQLAGVDPWLLQQPVGGPGLEQLLGGCSLKGFASRELAKAEAERLEVEKGLVVVQTGTLRL